MTNVCRWRACWRLSMSDVLQFTCPSMEFTWRQSQYCRISEQIVVDTIQNAKHAGLANLYKTCVVYGKAEHLLTALDKCK